MIEIEPTTKESLGLYRLLNTDNSCSVVGVSPQTAQELWLVECGQIVRLTIVDLPTCRGSDMT